MDCPSDDGTLLRILTESRELGFLGDAPPERQVAHARGFLSALAGEVFDDATFLDLGSGGGLPGLPLALALESTRFVLLESMHRRADFLRHAVGTLGIEDRVKVVERRAEEAGRDPGMRGAFDVVVARGFGRPGVTAECAAPFLRRAGHLVVSEPGAPDPAERAPRWPAAGCRELGLHLERTLSDPFGYAVLSQATLCPDLYPRRTGVPARRPLF